MARMSLEENKEKRNLDELITSHVFNKDELDSYKKICDAENAEIKDAMLEAGESEHSAGGYVAKRIVVPKESMNEDRLLMVLKKYWTEKNGSMESPFIKTREYIDMDALEDYLYNNELPNDVMADLASCKTTTEVVQLRISKEKKKKEE